MSVFINPKTGRPEEDRRGTVEESSLENKVGFALGKMITDISSIRALIDSNKKHTNDRFDDFREALKGSFDNLEEQIQRYLKDLEEDLKEDLNEKYELNNKHHSYIFKSIKNHQKRLVEIEKQPLEKAAKIVGVSSDLFWKMAVPIVVAVGTGLVVGLL